MADTSGQHLQSLLPWAANILRVTESLRLKLGNGHDSSVTDILGDARTQDLVHYFVDRGEVASIPDSAQAQMLSMREPILTYTDKLRVKWAERAQSFKLPAALVAMHQQAARAGADPSQMGLLVIEAIAHAAMHIYLLEKAQRVSLLLTDEETKGQKRMAILEHELKGLMYAQEFANPVYLARVERELRDVLDLYRSMLDGGAQEADLLRQQQVRFKVTV